MGMIDKKIEEAAKGYAKEKEKTCKKLAQKTGCCVAVSPDAAFKDGINWFLKSLWHPAEEEPKKGRVFLYKTIFGGYGINQIINGDEWKYIIKYQRATQWLYIDDLFSKKGDKQ